MFFKGVLASLAGPAPNYDMQRILATRNPREASLMNGMVTVVLMFPRYLMIAGITVLALAFCMPAAPGAGQARTSRRSFRWCCSGQVPDRRRRLPARGPRGGLHVELRRDAQRRARLRRERHLQAVHQPRRRRTAGRLTLSRIVSFVFLVVGIVFGLLTDRITDVMMWLVGALYSGVCRRPTS